MTEVEKFNFEVESMSTLLKDSFYYNKLSIKTLNKEEKNRLKNISDILYNMALEKYSIILLEIEGA